MRWLLLGVATVMVAGVASCGFGPFVADPGDCSVHPVEVASVAPFTGSRRLAASSCHQIVRVGEVQYIHQGEWPLRDEAIARLSEYGRISHVNGAWAFNLESPDDLTVWNVEGVDPALALWGTSASLRDSAVHVLWVVDDCSELDACTPNICGLVNPSAPNIEEWCSTA